ncbi:MAG: protein kinase, partial [Planctomycetes bacterium]|nr:protein kinase [Planctomycetota bacterium]
MEIEASETPAVDAGILTRFLEEAQVTGQLEHPGIVPVHELGLDASGRVYFTMRLVRGETLRSVFDKVHDSKNEDWSVIRALGAVLKVCEAMAYAHSKGVLHRDLKPANIMLGRYGETYVMDWGLAKIVGSKDRADIRIRESSESVAIASDREDAGHA